MATACDMPTCFFQLFPSPLFASQVPERTLRVFATGVRLVYIVTKAYRQVVTEWSVLDANNHLQGGLHYWRNLVKHSCMI